METYKKRILLSLMAGILFLVIYKNLPQEKYKDTPPLVGGEAYQTIHLTQEDFPKSMVKYYMDDWDINSVCNYDLLGWDSNDDFFYEKICLGLKTIYKYDGTQQKKVSNHPNDLQGKQFANRELFLTQSGANTPITNYDFTILLQPSIYLTEHPSLYLGEDQMQIAYVTQRTYSVYDVVLLKQE